MNVFKTIKKVLSALILTVFVIQNAFSMGLQILEIKPIISGIEIPKIPEKAVVDYDDLQRKTKETVNYGTFSLSYSYEYYPNGLMKSFTNADGDKVEYTYDNNNRLSVIKLPNGNDITWNSFQWNSPTQMTFPGGSKKNINYDGFMRVKNITSKDPGSNPLMNFNYAYSPVGNLMAKNTEHGNYAYTYDNLSRLKTAVNANAPNEAYSYDGLGNRLNQNTVISNEVRNLNLSFNLNNEITSIDLPGFNVSYDSNGNMSQKTLGNTTYNYFYDTENLLTQVDVTENSQLTTYNYYYDPFKRRLWKEGDGKKTYYFYSDEGLAFEITTPSEIVSSSEILNLESEIPEGATFRTYGYTPNSQWSTNPLFIKTLSPLASNPSPEYFFYHTDSQGTPQKITAINGAVVWDAVYDSFGNCTVLKEDITNNWRFAGQYADIETGLYYNWNRHYDPMLGRYLQLDPEGEGLNLYAYVFNCPTGFIDPTGTHALGDAWDSLQFGLETLAMWGSPFSFQDAVNTFAAMLDSSLPWGTRISAAGATVARVILGGIIIGSTAGLVLEYSGLFSNRISDDAFVRFDPSNLDRSIGEFGIQQKFFDQGKIWLTKYGDIKNMTDAKSL